MSVVYGGRGGDNGGDVVVGQPMEVAAVGGRGGDEDDEVVVVAWSTRCGGGEGGDEVMRLMMVIRVA
ncbi:hypothetical protein Tco_0621597 [Tanacetum coccineum]